MGWLYLHNMGCCGENWARVNYRALTWSCNSKITTYWNTVSALSWLNPILMSCFGSQTRLCMTVDKNHWESGYKEEFTETSLCPIEKNKTGAIHKPSHSWTFWSRTAGARQMLLPAWVRVLHQQSLPPAGMPEGFQEAVLHPGGDGRVSHLGTGPARLAELSCFSGKFNGATAFF